MLRLERFRDKRSWHGLRDGCGETGKESSSGKAVVRAGSGKPDSAWDVESPCNDVSGTAAKRLGQCIPEEGARSQTENTDANGVGSGGDRSVEGDRDLVEGL